MIDKMIKSDIICFIMDRFFKLPFRKFVKKQRRPLQLTIEDEVDKITQNPNLGIAKKSDLSGFRIHKFSYHKQAYLVSYRIQETEIVFFTVGPHENFYRNLKIYLKEVERL